MQATSLTHRLRRWMSVRDWLWWQLPPMPRAYVAAVSVGAVVALGVTAAQTNWNLTDAGKFLVLMTCGMISAVSTPRAAYTMAGGITRDFSTVWVLPVAILLPPFYAVLVPIPFVAVMHLFVHRGVPHRRVFTAASISLSYLIVALLFRAFPTSIAGGTPDINLHAFSWALAVAVCEFVGCRMQHFFIVGAVKLSDPKVKILAMELNRDAMHGLLVEIDLAVLITVAVAMSPGLVLLALPTVGLVRRFLVYPLLVAQSRVDAKTGLLNVSTWEQEAEAELSRAVRTREPLALALIDIDHFKAVNDTHGHLVGDRVLKALAEALRSQLRDYDRAGRFGGEEFVLLLPQTSEPDGCKIAERLRSYVEHLAVPVSDRPDAPAVKITISVGVTALAAGETLELTDLLAASDSALYHAKQTGRNRVSVAPAERNMGLDAAFTGTAFGAPGAGDGSGDRSHPDPGRGGEALSNGGGRSPRADPARGPRPAFGMQAQPKPTALSLCPNMSLSVSK